MANWLTDKRYHDIMATYKSSLHNKPFGLSPNDIVDAVLWCQDMLHASLSESFLPSNEGIGPRIQKPVGGENPQS